MLLCWLSPYSFTQQWELKVFSTGDVFFRCKFLFPFLLLLLVAMAVSLDGEELIFCILAHFMSLFLTAERTKQEVFLLKPAWIPLAYNNGSYFERFNQRKWRRKELCWEQVKPVLGTEPLPLNCMGIRFNSVFVWVCLCVFLFFFFFSYILKCDYFTDCDYFLYPLYWSDEYRPVRHNIAPLTGFLWCLLRKVTMSTEAVNAKQYIYWECAA